MPAPATLLARSVVLALVVACRPPLPPGAEHSLVDKRAPTFLAATLSGEDLDLTALRGKIVVIKFFARWCEPCQRTLPEFERLHRARRSDEVFFAISEDHQIAEAQAQVDAYELSFPVVLDHKQAILSYYQVRDLPVIFVLDRRGIVRWVGGPEQTGVQVADALVSVHGLPP